MKLKPLLLLFFSQTLLAQGMSCQLSGKIVPTTEYPEPTNVFTKLKNDGLPMMAFGFLVADSQPLKQTTAVDAYCASLHQKTLTVILSGNHPDGSLKTGQRVSLRHQHQDKNVWPYWPDYYELR